MTHGRIADLEARVRQLADDYEESERRADALRRELAKAQGAIAVIATECGNHDILTAHHAVRRLRMEHANARAELSAARTAIECAERRRDEAARECDEALLRGVRLGLEAAAEACDWLPQHSSAETARHCRELVRALDPAAIVAAESAAKRVRHIVERYGPALERLADGAEPPRVPDALAALAGTWPGDESDAELVEQMRAFEEGER